MSGTRTRGQRRILGQSGSVIVQILVVLLIAGVVTVVGAFVYVATNKVEVEVANNGCHTFRLRSSMPPEAARIVSILGIDLPEEIPSGGKETLRLGVLPLSIRVDMRDKARIRVTMLGITVPASISGDMPDVALNGRMLSGQLTNVKLTDRDRHELVVTCE